MNYFSFGLKEKKNLFLNAMQCESVDGGDWDLNEMGWDGMG